MASSIRTKAKSDVKWALETALNQYLDTLGHITEEQHGLDEITDLAYPVEIAGLLLQQLNHHRDRQDRQPTAKKPVKDRPEEK